MINKTINIDVDYDKMGVSKSPRQTTLTTYILEKNNIEPSIWKKRPAVIICPGGGYSITSSREAEPIAFKYASAGFHAFILNYSVAPSAWPAAITELSKSIVYVRSIADEYLIDSDKIFVAGFSAGGHLAASVGVHYNHEDVIKYSGADGINNKPNGIILGYPVITSEKEYAHQGSIDNITGGNKDLVPLMSLENYVTPETPEMFIFHTFADATVPVKNSLYMANALEKNHVKFELHIYPDGGHGLSLSNEVSAHDINQVIKPVADWIDLSVRWIKDK